LLHTITRIQKVVQQFHTEEGNSESRIRPPEKPEDLRVLIASVLRGVPTRVPPVLFLSTGDSKTYDLRLLPKRTRKYPSYHYKTMELEIQPVFAPHSIADQTGLLAATMFRSISNLVRTLG
jgi:hypothetical protein